MELTEKRKQELIDLDLDVLNLIKNIELEEDTSIMYLRASGDREDDCDALFITAENEQLSLALWGSIDKDEDFRHAVFNALINYFSCDENREESVGFLLNLSSATQQRELETIK